MLNNPSKPLLNVLPASLITPQPSTSSITSLPLSIASQASLKAREIAAARAKEVERAKNLQSMLMKDDIDSCDSINSSDAAAANLCKTLF